MEKHPVVSVAIPFYNQERYVSETLTSVLAQKAEFDYEILCGDDHSADKTYSILEEFQKRDPGKVRIFSNPRNMGLVLNVKNIFENCRGKYIALLGGDDLFLDETKLQRQHDFLEKNVDYGLVHSDAQVWVEGSDGKKETYESADTYFKRDVKTGYVFDDFLIKNFIIPSTVLFRKELYDKHVDLQHYLSIGFQAEDTPMFLELARWSKFGYMAQPLTAYRVSAGTLSRPKDRKKAFLFYESSFRGRRYFLDKYCTDPQTKKRFMEKYHSFSLKNAFEFRMPQRADESYQYLKKILKPDLRTHLFYLGAKIWLIWIVVKMLRQLTKPFRSRR